MDVSFLGEHFGNARRALMLPHSRGEAESIMDAFHECDIGLYGIDRSKFEDTPRAWVEKLDTLMNTAGLSDPSSEGLWLIKARKLTVDNKPELSRIVDELANWFNRRFWENN